VRLAGSDDVFSRLSATSKETSTADQVDSVVEQIEVLRAKGLGDQAAIQHGLNIWNGTEEAVEANPRFAAIYGDSPSNDSGNSGPVDGAD
jgi:hypothetical protein|tara:strand:+ start:927 stop:1196 length:270 start_codon:yes stop_codon:yes gene_type:complete